jgi:deazaflavin-dependent oxidoreductase (nitroreductase family)
MLRLPAITGQEEADAMAPPASRPRPPTGWRRTVARIPVHLYRAGFGSVFGDRMMLLTHACRATGQPRRVVLEVVAHSTEPRSWTVASGYGPSAQWYRNLRQEPRALVQVGNRYHAVSAYFFSPEEGAEIMARYAPFHPRSARAVCRCSSLPVDGSTEGFREAGRSIPFVRLTEYPTG